MDIASSQPTTPFSILRCALTCWQRHFASPVWWVSLPHGESPCSDVENRMNLPEAFCPERKSLAPDQSRRLP